MRTRRERAALRVDPCDPSPEFLRGCFAAIFASLDERPRLLSVDVFARYESGEEAVLDMKKGDPVFSVGVAKSAEANFRLRWIAEHPVPLSISGPGPVRLEMLPASGNRVKVRLALRSRIARFMRLHARWRGRGAADA